MYEKLAMIAVFSLFVVIALPAYADVTSMRLEKSFYTTEEDFRFIGTQSGTDTVFVIIRDPTGQFKGMLSDPNPDTNKFSVIPRSVTQFFAVEGIYNATAFTDDQKEDDGITIRIEFDGNKIFEVPDFVLQLNTISDKTVEEGKTLTFTPTLTETVEGVVFSLEKNPPSGATINAETGKFVWTPTASQGPASYLFDIVVTKGAQVDRETVKITVTEKTEPAPQPEPKPEPAPQPEPEPMDEPKELGIASFVDPTRDPQSYVDRYNNEASYKEWFDKNYPEYSSIYEAVGLEKPLEIPASFVDPTRDPQSYVDRYNNEASYKEWFDKNYPEYSSIYEAVGLDEPKELAPFVDPTRDPQSYVDRYNNEASYKEWFDKNYPEYSSIYEAVGLDEPKKPEVKEPEFGVCGTGTKLVNGKCTIIEKPKEGGGCLIATATYGSEMAPQVQFLREIRDGKVMTTESGAAFMSGFNEFYYSFSPYVADYERENPIFKEIVKVGITPMLSSLSVMSLADTEQEIVGYGIIVILMNLGMYVGAPAMMVYGASRIRKVRF
ncbi:MAG: putative Ig domain-containing protein [Nitrosarchaeum sp.]|nr:putative Ig domain-containing protein [Nitrosarchaeum sp.]